MDHSERLHRLALTQVAQLVGAPGDTDSWLVPNLDPKTTALVRLGALVTMGGGGVSAYGTLTDGALSAGASLDEIVDVLLVLLPLIGPVRVSTAATNVALALGDDIDDLPDGWSRPS